MKIRILENIVGLNFSYTIGQIVKVEKELGLDLINARYAVAEDVKVLKRNAKKSGDE